jgi:hypothetical protein
LTVPAGTQKGQICQSVDLLILELENLTKLTDRQQTDWQICLCVDMLLEYAWPVCQRLCSKTISCSGISNTTHFGVGCMAWVWIRISLDSWMVVLMVLVQTSFSNYLILNVNIPTYLGSRGTPFFLDFLSFFHFVCRSLVSTILYTQICIIQIHTHKFIGKFVFYMILYVWICTYKIWTHWFIYEFVFLYNFVGTNLYLRTHTH